MATSFDQAAAYFLDSMTGASPATKLAYERDLLQFKLYLVLYRRHLIVRGNDDDLPELQAELQRTDGKLVDTRFAQRKHRFELRSRALLDRFDVAVDAIRKEEIVGYFSYLESERSLARSTLARRLSSLRRFFSLLSKEGYGVAPEVLEKLEDIKVRRDRHLPLTLERQEALDFLSVIDNPRDRAIVLVMLYMGLRISEVVRLNVDDITEQTDGITFRGKGGKERYVPIHPSVRSAIAAYKPLRPKGVRDELGEPLFVSRHRRRIDPRTVRHFIKEYARRASLLDNSKRQRMSPHKLRHTFATLLLQGDVDIRHIQELLGHENLATTEIYTRVNRQDLRKAVERHPLG